MNKPNLVFHLIAVATLLAIVCLTFHRSFLEPSVLERELQRFRRLAPRQDSSSSSLSLSEVPKAI
jgi:hypothetical protein